MDSLKIDSLLPSPVGLTEPAEALAGLIRLAAGELPELHLGERFPARVLDATTGQALIDLHGARVVIDRPPGVQPGSELTVRVAALAPRPVFAVQTHAPETLALPSWPAGRELVVHLLQRLPEGRLLIAVNGTHLEAEAPPDLRPGVTLPVRVEQAGSQVVFRILDRESLIQAHATKLLRANLPQLVTAGDSLGRLQQALARQPRGTVPPSVARLEHFIPRLVPPGGPPTPESLAAVVRDGGLGYEAKLARQLDQGPADLARVAASDLKGLLLQATHDLEAAGPGEISFARSERYPLSHGTEAPRLADALADHLGHIETHQALNLLARLHDSPYRLQVPFVTGQGPTTALLAVEPDSPGAGGPAGQEQGYNVLLHLDLENLGSLHIDAHLTAKTVRAVFYVNQTETRALLQQEMPAFRERLQTLGYGEVLLATRPLAQLTPEKKQQFAALAGGVPDSVRLVDVRA